MICGRTARLHGRLQSIWRKYEFQLHGQKRGAGGSGDGLLYVVFVTSRAGRGKGFGKGSGKGILDRGGKSLVELRAAWKKPDQAGCRAGGLGRNAGLSQIPLYRL